MAELKNCKVCGDPFKSFNSLQTKCVKCSKQLKQKRPMNKIGPVGRKWINTRNKWLEINKTPYYFCYLCGKQMTRSQLTLDHIEARSRKPELRFNWKNLKPCCFSCNQAKGSLSVDEYLKTINVERTKSTSSQESID